MKLGTARKWVEHMERLSGEWYYDDTELRFNGPFGTVYGGPVGALCDFLDPTGWVAPWPQPSVVTSDPPPSAWGVDHPSAVFLAWHGERFRLPQEWMKVCKAKTDLIDLPDLVYTREWSGPVRPAWMELEAGVESLGPVLLGPRYDERSQAMWRRAIRYVDAFYEEL